MQIGSLWLFRSGPPASSACAPPTNPSSFSQRNQRRTLAVCQSFPRFEPNSTHDLAAKEIRKIPLKIAGGFCSDLGGVAGDVIRKRREVLHAILRHRHTRRHLPPHTTPATSIV